MFLRIWFVLPWGYEIVCQRTQELLVERLRLARRKVCSPGSIFSSRIRKCRPVGYAFYDGAHQHLWWLRLQLPVRGGLICFRVGAPLCDLHASSLQDAMPLGHSSIMQITWVSVTPSFFRWECKIFFVALQHNFLIFKIFSWSLFFACF